MLPKRVGGKGKIRIHRKSLMKQKDSSGEQLVSTAITGLMGPFRRGPFVTSAGPMNEEDLSSANMRGNRLGDVDAILQYAIPPSLLAFKQQLS
ncbi:hypothetical protein TNCT_233131 [Trichonephila clavata]|uniref:Uncharacterized protein n=1 Tax=Trichonephila clavata TaxID=2740835 RepID=A0A8X6GCZ1_TRICU|nr:hypothetical protein TNCT_233131 [Trichonephila clavata]